MLLPAWPRYLAVARGTAVRTYRRLLDLAQVRAGPQGMVVGGLQSLWQEAGETNSPTPLPAASYSKVGVTIPNDGQPKVGQFNCPCQQISILINPESTECKWSLCDRFSKMLYFQAAKNQRHDPLQLVHTPILNLFRSHSPNKKQSYPLPSIHLVIFFVLSAV